MPAGSSGSRTVALLLALHSLLSTRLMTGTDAPLNCQRGLKEEDEGWPRGTLLEAEWERAGAEGNAVWPMVWLLLLLQNEASFCTAICIPSKASAGSFRAIG